MRDPPSWHRGGGKRVEGGREDGRGRRREGEREGGREGGREICARRSVRQSRQVSTAATVD